MKICNFVEMYILDRQIELCKFLLMANHSENFEIFEVAQSSMKIDGGRLLFVQKFVTLSVPIFLYIK